MEWWMIGKAAGCFCIGAACLLTGHEMETHLKQRRKFFRDLEALLHYLEKEVLQRRVPLTEALAEAANLYAAPWSQILVQVAEDTSKRTGETFQVLWENAVFAHLPERFLKPEEQTAVMQIALSLCGADTLVQRTLIQNSLESVGEYGRKAALECEEKGKLYRKLSAAAGALLLILFI